MNKIFQPPLSDERKQTDKSLTVERGKTDESFANYKGKAEFETDNAITKNRLEADTARLQRRSEANILRDGVQAESKSKKDQDVSEQHIIKERKSEDTAVEKERSKNDLAIEVERGEKERLLNKIVNLERAATDKNLLSEREKTDLVATLSAERLTVEQAAHLCTQSELTTREEFVAIVSHDLRNPIGAILSATELLLDNSLIIAAGKETAGLVDLIKRNAEASLRLISDILDMERIAEGQLQLQLQSHRISDLIKESIERHEHIAAAKKTVLKSSIENASEFITCDKDRINQVLSNLIGNALKFTSDGGVVTVAVESIENNLKFSISDTGPGIPDDQKSRVFEKFAQISNKNRQGLGLGLFISKSLVESHKGKLTVTSTLGKGSTFSFTLPK